MPATDDWNLLQLPRLRRFPQAQAATSLPGTSPAAEPVEAFSRHGPSGSSSWHLRVGLHRSRLLLRRASGSRHVGRLRPVAPRATTGTQGPGYLDAAHAISRRDLLKFMCFSVRMKRACGAKHDTAFEAAAAAAHNWKKKANARKRQIL